jgi:hypothetical protein
MTTDFGKTWTTISNGLPEDWVYVVRQDPHNPNLLYAGMEHGVFASWDKGKTWMKINTNLPSVSVRDLRVQKRERDLVVATHGRGIWILDDISAIENFGTVGGKELHVFPSKTATLWQYYSMIEEQGDRAYRAKNPEYGAYINFNLQSDPKQPITVEIMDANGMKVRSLKDTVSKAGVNRIVWDLRYEEAEKINTPVSSGWGNYPQRPLVGPGIYTAKVSANGQTAETKITVRADPRIVMTDQDFKLRTESVIALRDQLSQTHKIINNTDATLKQLNELKQRIKTAGDQSGIDATVNGQIDEAIKKLKEFEDEILRRPPPNMGYRQKPRLKEEIADLLGAIDDATARPTNPQLARTLELKQETQDATNQLDRIIQQNVTPINDKVKNLPQIVVGKGEKKEM